jgi:homoserine kinase type II
MVALTDITPDALRALLERYGLGAPERYWPAAHGIENTNYFVRLRGGGTAGREYVLTVLETPSPSLPFVIELLKMLDGAGLPVAAPLHNRAGAAVDVLDGKPVLLSPRLPGRHVQNPTLEHCEAVGRVLARLHSAAMPLAETAPVYPRDVHWIAARIDETAGRAPYSDRALLEQCSRAVRGMFARHDVQQLPRGVVHGDLFRDNALFDGPALSGVLDFHHAARNFLIYDLAVAANDWCSQHGGMLHPERICALLRGYDRVRRLRDDEILWLPMFGLYAALAFWLSRLTPWLAARSEAGTGRSAGRMKNPDELKVIARAHLAHRFVPSPRWFRTNA